VLKALADLEVVKRIGPQVKMARWFSWWTVARWHRKHLYSQLMLLKYYHVEVLGKSLEDLHPVDNTEGDASDIEEVAADPKKELARLRQGGDNTLSISIRLLSEKNIRNMDILLQITAPTQAEHALRARDKVTPAQNLAYCCQSVDTWQRIPVQTMARACYNETSLRDMGIVRERPSWYDPAFAADQRERCSIALDFAMCLVTERCSDLMVQTQMPPGSFAALLAGGDRQQQALADAEFQWCSILWLESKARKSNDWALFLSSLQFLKWPAHRAVYMLLEASVLASS
jgi:hypothetical protein